MVRRKSKSKFSKLLVIVTQLLIISVLLSFLANYYWAFDLFSHFVFQYAAISAVLLVIFLASKKYKWAAIVFVVCLSQLYKLTPFFDIEKINMAGRYDNVKVLQYNVHRGNKNVEEITRWIVSKSEDIDVVVLLELTDRWQESLRRIKWAYPYFISKDMRGGRNMVVFSRLYIDELEVKHLGQAEAPAIILRGETTGYEVPFVLYGVHPPPPVLPSYTKRRNDILLAVGKEIAQESIDHKLLVADLNTTRFSPVFQQLTENSGLTDSNKGLGFGALQTTWPKFLSQFFGLTIDNILISNNIGVEKREIGPAMGSDHFPVITTLRFMADEKGKEIL